MASAMARGMKALVDYDRPCAHVAPQEGWLNDPNGVIFYKGRFHVFYQHVPGQGCEWQWGLVWGHAVSSDLAHWRHLPPALVPTPGGPDADGCWSGCCAVSPEGVPTLLYTGVRLRSSHAAGPPPPPGQDLGLPFIESQCAAVLEDPDDDLLLRWRKVAAPAVALPPPGLSLTGWRDPFVYHGGSALAAAHTEGGAGQRSGQQGRRAPRQGRRLLLGSGIHGAGGALLAYSCTAGGGGGGRDNGSSSPADDGGSSLCGGWRYEGLLCSTVDLAVAALQAAAADGGCGEKPQQALAAALELGEVWECPLLAPLPTGGGRDGGSAHEGGAPWLLACSPYPVKPPYAGQQPANPVLYWIGRLNDDATRFDLAGALGPFRLDHGDVLYAPNACSDAQGRLLMWAWLQERRPPGASAAYAGCLTLPRQLSLAPDGRRLVQRPAPGLAALRRCPAAEGSPAPGGSGGAAAASGAAGGAGWCAGGVEVPEGQLLPIEGVEGAHLDIELKLSRGSAAAAGLLILSHVAGSQGNALLTYDWPTNSLELRFGVPAPETTASGGGGSGGGGGEAGGQSPGVAGTPRWRLPQPPAAASPAAEQLAAVAEVAATSDLGNPPGSPAAAAVAAASDAMQDLLLAELATPLADAAAVQAAVVEGVAASAAARRLGGPLAAPAADAAGRVALRVILDGSALECYTGSGEVLSTRVYRGAPPSRAAPSSGSSASGGGGGPPTSGVFVAALGGAALLESGAAWELSSCWE